MCPEEKCELVFNVKGVFNCSKGSLLSSATVAINADTNVTIDHGCHINTDGLGQFTGSGFGFGAIGGSFGGSGGKFECYDDTVYYSYTRTTSDIIGDPAMPHIPEVWSMSYGSGSLEVPGGGRINITTSGALILNGDLSANGNNAKARGGGSGGGIVCWASSIYGDGTISANGGDGAFSPRGTGGGGGGRVSLWYLSYDPQDPSLSEGSVNVKGGDGVRACNRGGSGTFYEGRLCYASILAMTTNDHQNLGNQPKLTTYETIDLVQSYINNNGIIYQTDNITNKYDLIVGSLQIDNKGVSSLSVTPLGKIQAPLHSIIVSGGGVLSARNIEIAYLNQNVKETYDYRNDLSVNADGIVLPMPLPCFRSARTFY